jgi:hypothetical protein
VNLALGLGRDNVLSSNGRATRHPSARQRWFRAKLHSRSTTSSQASPYICCASVLNCYVQPPGGSVRVLHWVQGYLAHQEAHACARKCIALRELLAAINFASHTAIMPGTAPSSGAPPRGFCTRCEALALLNRDASPETCTSSEPIHSPPPPPKPAHAAHKSQTVSIGIPRARSGVSALTWGEVTSSLQPRNAEAST